MHSIVKQKIGNILLRLIERPSSIPEIAGLFYLVATDDRYPRFVGIKYYDTSNQGRAKSWFDRDVEVQRKHEGLAA